jgi:hypothetical protein
MFTNFFERAHNANAEFVTLGDLSQRVRAEQAAHINVQTVGNTITATVTPDASAPDLGKFALNLDNNPGQVIKSVQNWYAYDQDSVFIPKDGGQFTINLGTTQDDVTHIDKLPSRADLITVDGDGSALNFTMDGDGQVVVHLQPLASKQVAIVGSLDAALQGNELGVTLHTSGQHTVSVKDGGVVPNGVEGVIHYLDQQNNDYATLFHFADNTTWTQFRDVSGNAAWSDFTSYSDAQNQTYAQLVHERDGSGWTQFWDATGIAAWKDFTSYSNANNQYYAQTVHERDGTGWTQFWDVKNEGTWDQYASYVDGQGRKFEEYILNDDRTVARAFWDVDNQHEWATYTQVYDAAGQLIHYYGTNHDGTTWVTL